MQPSPAGKKPAPGITLPNLALVLFGVLVLFCCGGGIVSTFAEDTTPNQAAEYASRQEAPATPTAASRRKAPATAATTSPAAVTAEAAPSATATARTTNPSVRPATRKPTPKPTTKKPRPKPTTEEPEPEPEAYYKNCTAVRAAGADPIRSGDPGYGRHLDRDGDGVGCE
ncbi:excalibur calcium-binding domain-containing protein [Actinoplanes derwentensis]|uniref:Excalibur calcium-binding domain-containing protein n=1 Tax=Actinoplanes derwentensis TaxID=113562 RepID=A0A1H1ZNA1_9ACTN|nr:excalibur calcium-binding domain-containing protein [Actinoplanes derwentensis]GID82527.1 hypothetical protein Ade03nite_14510 [Actinoplanes derwentensis]SDT35089.1 Excalibur calcium-binding domain-containing protein [Actinoplanes derwentensis]